MLLALALALSPANAGKITVGPVDLPDTIGARTMPTTSFGVPNADCSKTDAWMVVQVLPDEVRYAGDAVSNERKGLLMPGLFQALTAHVEARKAAMAQGCLALAEQSLLFALDESVPWGDVAPVMYTAGQAGITRHALLVDDPSPVGRWQPAQAMGGGGSLQLSISLIETGIVVRGNSELLPELPTDEDATLPCDGGCTNADSYDWAGLHALLTQVKAGHAQATRAVIVPDNAAPVVLLERALPVVVDTGFPDIVFAAGEMEDSGQFGQVWPDPSKFKLDTKGDVAVITSVLPAIPEVGVIETASADPSPVVGVLAPDEPARVQIQGGMSRFDIDEVIDEARQRIGFCYERALVDNPELAGSSVHRFTIAADGAVTQSYAKSSTLNDDGAQACIDGVIEGLIFPEPEAGGTVIVTYPFDFGTD